jgi:hypothetical protein
MTWYDQNELIAWPLVGNDDNQIPSDLIVDCVVHAPSALGQQLQLISISSTALLVSCVLAIDGTPVAYLTALKANVPLQQSVSLTPIVTGVSGFLAFGFGITTRLLRVDGVYNFISSSLIRYDFDASSPTLTVGATAFTGLVNLVGAGGIEIEAQTISINPVPALNTLARGAQFNSAQLNAAQFNLPDSSISGTPLTTVCAFFTPTVASMYSDPVASCFKPVDGRPDVQPVSAINGVLPDVNGNLNIKFLAIAQNGSDPVFGAVTSPGQIVVTDGGSPCGS